MFGHGITLGLALSKTTETTSYQTDRITFLTLLQPQWNIDLIDQLEGRGVVRYS